MLHAHTITKLVGVDSPLLVSTKSGSLVDLPAKTRLSFTSVDSLDPRPILGGDLNSELARIASSEQTNSVEAVRVFPEDAAEGDGSLVFKLPYDTLSPGKLDIRKSRSMDVLSPTGPPPKGEKKVARVSENIQIVYVTNRLIQLVGEWYLFFIFVSFS